MQICPKKGLAIINGRTWYINFKAESIVNAWIHASVSKIATYVTYIGIKSKAESFYISILQIQEKHKPAL